MSEIEKLSQLVTRLRAPNPGPMTLTGTNSYLIGTGAARIAIDPGPVIEEHLAAMVAHAAVEDAAIGLILVTHGHPDHYPGAAHLQELTGAPVAAWTTAAFPHDQNLTDNQRVTAAGVNIVCLYTPGHAVDHLCFFLEEEAALFTGDNILGEGTTIVAPPKGDMADYMATLHRLDRDYQHAKVIYGGHGPAITDPAAKFHEYITHREKRSTQVLTSIAGGAQTIPQIVAQVYAQTDRRLWPAAARQVLAQLNMLEQLGTVKVLNEVAATPEETALLNPSGIIDPVALAELGINLTNETMLKRYVVVSG